MPRRPKLCFEAAGMTDRGLLRTDNQDSFLVRPDLGLFAVADGISQSPAGALASALAVLLLERSLERPARRDSSSHRPSRDPRPRLVRAFQHAQAGVCEAGRRDPGHDGMSTTLAALLAAGDRVALAHVGDSRIYRVRGREDVHPFLGCSYRWYTMEALTTDHNVGHDREWRAANPRSKSLADPAHRSLLTRSIGRGEPIRIATRLERLEPGDTFVLTTDGIHGAVYEDELEAPFLKPRRVAPAMGPSCSLSLPHMQCAWLVARAMRRGGPDNATVVVVRFRKGRCRWPTERGVGYVVHAPPFRGARTERELPPEEDEGVDEDEG